MRTPFKTLTIGLVLATAAMAGCSSTTGSSGAVQNDATASASSAASAAAFCCSRMLMWMGLKLAPSRLGEAPSNDITQI